MGEQACKGSLDAQDEDSSDISGDEWSDDHKEDQELSIPATQVTQVTEASEPNNSPQVPEVMRNG